MKTRIVIKNLPRNVRDDDIRDLCRSYGPVTEVKVQGGKGIAFVTFRAHADAQYAIYDLNNRKEYRGDKLFVNWSKPELKNFPPKDGDAPDEEKKKDPKEPKEKKEEKKEEKPARPLFSELQQAKVVGSAPRNPSYNANNKGERGPAKHQEGETKK